jgi:tRNASer (uridine44-2'-O)-methyltransferase
MQMVEHPEWNSTLILRTETVHHLQEPNLDITTVPLIKDHIAVKNIRRRLLPRRPGRDEPVQQDCTLYTTEHEYEKRSLSLLILTPVLTAGEELPYYHPAVDHLALRYVPSVTLATPTITNEANASPVYGDLQVLVVPHDGAAPQNPSSRLHRTCRALLETIHRYGWGALTSYKKRVRHDYLVPRSYL